MNRFHAWLAGAAIALAVAQPSAAQTGWFIVPSGTSHRLNSVYDPDGNVIALGDSGTVVRSPYPDTSFTTETPTVSQGLWGLGENYVGEPWISGERGTVLQSTDAGRTWVGATSPSPSINLYGMDANGGYQWCCGDSGAIFQSVDNGQHWSRQLSGTYARLNCEILGFTIVGDNGTVVRSSNFGTTWTTTSAGTTENLYRIVNDGGNSLLAVGAHGTITRSTDNGATWTSSVSHVVVDLHGCSAFGNLCLACGDGGTILKSSDYGVTWGAQTSPTSLPLYGIIMLDGVHYVAVGASGVILRTNDGGGTVTDVQSGPVEPPEEFALEQNYPNPFNPSTLIGYRLSTAGLVSLKVYDVIGREVATLVSAVQQPGSHRVEFSGSNLASGVYFYQLRTGAGVATRKLMLLK